MIFDNNQNELTVLAAGAEKPDVGVANPKPDVVVAGLLKPKPVLGEEPNAGAVDKID